jgi:hypothetical protein
MKIFNHHAYFSIGGQDAVEQIIQLLKKENFATSGNSDFLNAHFENFGIDEARLLKEMDSRQAHAERKVFIVSFDTTTTEAQNALLKTVEEPLGGSHFFLCVPSENILLPTLRSRLLFLSLESTKSNLKEAESFLKMSVDERLAFAHKLSDDFKKGKRTKKDEIDFLDGLEEVLSKNHKGLDATKLQKVLELKSYAPIRGSSVKMILETAAILLPKC